MSRLTRKTYEELTEDQREVFDNIVASRPVKPKDGHIGGPFDIWLRSPELGRRLVGLGGFFRFNTTVDRRYIELVILVTGHGGASNGGRTNPWPGSRRAGRRHSGDQER